MDIKNNFIDYLFCCPTLDVYEDLDNDNYISTDFHNIIK